MSSRSVTPETLVFRTRSTPEIEARERVDRRLVEAHNHRIPASPAHHVGLQHDRVATTPGLYTIRIQGRLGATALSAFPSMESELNGGETVLTGLLEDRSAVFGVVAQIEALGLELLELRQIPARPSVHNRNSVRGGKSPPSGEDTSPGSWRA